MISAVVITKNEEGNIDSCLKSLLWCDEMVVVDDFSTDGTAEIAEKCGAKVFKRKLEDDFSAQRNFGLKKAKGEWVLFIDADEYVSESLSQEILEVIVKGSADGYLLKRVGVVDEWVLRLGRGGRWGRKVHEKWEINGLTKKLHSPLLHSPSLSVSKALEKTNWYSTIHARSNKKERKRADLGKIIFYPPIKFFHYYFLKSGYRSGLYGFIFSVFMSFHSFLAWSKLWALQEKN